jgi:hypothetical protein
MIQFWPHQAKTIEFGKNNPIIFDTSSAGTGKTAAHLAILDHKIKIDGVTRALIVCPKTLMLSAWAQEIEDNFAHLTYTLALPPNNTRLAAFDTPSDIVIINTDALTVLANEGRRWLKKRMGNNPALIIDESSWLKNSSAQRTKAAFDIAGAFKHRALLSGTPAPNSVVELWAQVKILDGGQRLGTRIGGFERVTRHREFSEKGYPMTVDNDDAKIIAYGLIADISVGHKFDEVMKHVPAMTQSVRWYTLPEAVQEKYNTLQATAVLKFLDENKTVTAANAGVLANKLLQCASGAVYTDPDHEEKGWQIIDTGRYELIAQLVDERDQCVIFFNWKHQKAGLIKELEKIKASYSVIDGSVTSARVRASLVKDFQSGNTKTMLMHFKTGAFGLTLTAARSVIWCSPVYGADSKEQGDARIRRGVQDKPTESIMVLAKHTYDVDAYEVFTGKKQRMDGLNALLQRFA